MKLEQIHLTCPNCHHEFDSTRMGPADGPGCKHTDFHVAPDRQHSLEHAVHLCEQCGFSGPESWFNSAEGVSYEVRCRVWNELAPRVGRTPLPASERFEFAARVATWDGAPRRVIADLWLRAAWSCVDEGDTEAERYYRRHAAWTFEQALEDYGGVDRADRAVITYLVGELWRRIGDESLAELWFGRVSQEIIDFMEQKWLVRLAKQQRDDPREWFV